MSSAKRTKRSASAEPRRSPPMHEDESAPQLEAVDLALLDEEEGEDVSTATPKKPGFSGGFDALKSLCVAFGTRLSFFSVAGSNGQVYSGMAIGGSHKCACGLHALCVLELK